MNKQDKIFGIADRITKFNFSTIWDIEGDITMTLRKEEIAEEMFFKGIAYILDHLDTFDEINLDSVEESFKEIE